MKLIPPQTFDVDSLAGLLDRETHYETDREIAHKISRMSGTIQQERRDGLWGDIEDTAHTSFLSAVKNENLDEIVKQTSNFFREPVSKGLVSHGTFDDINNDPDKWQAVQETIFGDLETWMLLTDHIYDMEPLVAPLVGNPYGLAINPGALITPDACRHQYHAHIVGGWLDKIKCARRRLTVLEIGGGFGGFAYYLHKLEGDYLLTYIDIDLEVPLCLSLYYLMTTLPGLFDRRLQVLFTSSQGLTRNDLNSADIILAHANAADNINLGIDVVYNSNSLSEMPESDIARYFDLIDRCNPSIIFQQNSNLVVCPDDGWREFPASRFPYPKRYVEVYRAKSPWSSKAGFYYEFLHLRDDCLNL